MPQSTRTSPLSNGAAGRAGLEAPRFRVTPITAAVALAMLAVASPMRNAQAAPANGEVTAGNAVIQQSGTQTVITQSSARAAINWQSFGINANESVIFRQPSSSAVALNRVTGPDPSAIYGTLQANGQVFLINPNGVLFARGARVDVAALVASTLDIGVDDFMQGRYVFSGGPGSGPHAGTVRNDGKIRTADGGYVALLGKNVSNAGTITVPNGTVAVGAGEAMVLDFHGDGLLSLKVNAAEAKAKIENKGEIHADGGAVIMSARAKDALLDTVLNVEGIVTAKGFTQRGGHIYLDGGASGLTSVSGTVDASSAQAKGGEIRVLGEYVGLFGNAKLDASGDRGGGTVLVGGDYQGRNPDVANALRTYVAPDAQIRADALTTGDGGKVIVWADDWTKFYGNISARGGAEGGNGGFAEVSGKRDLIYSGLTDLRAPNGNFGTLLLDPGDLTIIDGMAGPGTNVACTPGSCTVPVGGPYTDSSTAAGAQLTDGTLNQQLLLGNVSVVADGITANSDVSVTIPITRTLTYDSTTYMVLGGAYSGGGSLALNFATSGAALLNLAANTYNVTAVTATANGNGNGIIQGPHIANTWTVTGANAGSTANGNGTVSFSGVQSLAGGMSTDSFTLAGGTLTGSIDGAAGINTLTGSNGANTWTITSFDSGTVTGLGSGFANVQNVVGGTSTDVFNLNGGTLSGAIGGGGGANTLVGNNVANTWRVTASNSGTVTGVGGGFNNVQNLVGGTNADAFTLDGGALTGAIDGGGGTNTLLGNNVVNNWTVTAFNSGTLTGVAGGFSNVQNLVGGTAADTFTGAGGSLNGAITDPAGTTTLNGTLSVGAAHFTGPVALGSSTTLTAGAGDINFSTVDGAFELALSSTGATTFSGAVGGTTPLGALSVTASSTSIGGNIRTDSSTGGTAAVTINAPAVLRAPGGIVTIDTDSNAGGNAGNVTFMSAVNGDGAATQTLVIDARETGAGAGSGGSVTFAGLIGSAAATRLAGLGVASGSVSVQAEPNNVDNLAVALSGVGNGVTYVDGDSVTVGNVGGINGISTTGAGAVTLTANGGGNSATVSSQITSGSGPVVITADDVVLTGTINNGTSGAVTFRPFSASATIGVEDATRVLKLTNTELNNVTTGTIIIGSPANTGGIFIATDNGLSQGAKNFQFTTAGNIAIGANNFTTTGNVGLLADNAGNTAAITSGAGRIAGNLVTATADAGIELNTSAASLTVDNTTANNVTVNELDGVTLAGTFRNQTATGTLDLTANGSIDTSTATVSSNSGQLTLRANDLANTAVAITVGSGGISSGGGNIRLFSADHIALGGNVNTGGPGSVALESNGGNSTDVMPDNFGAITRTAGTITGNLVSLGAATGIGSAGGAGSINTTAITVFAQNATSGNVNIVETNDVSVSGTNSGGGAFNVTVSGAGNTLTVNGGGINASSGATTLISGGNIAGAGTVTAATVVLDSGTGIGIDSGNRLRTAAGTLAARTRGTSGGGVFVAETDAVTLSTVGAVANGSAGLPAYDILAGGTITVDSPIATPGGAITLQSTAGAITSTAAGTITTTAADATATASGAVQITAATSIDLLGKIGTRAAHAFAFAVSAGSVTLTGPGGIAVAEIDTSGNGADSIAGGSAAGNIAFGSPASITLRGNIIARGGDGNFGFGTAGNGANLTFGAPVTLAGDVTIDTRGGANAATPGTDGNVTFSGTLNSLAAGSEKPLTVNTAGATTFGGTVGGSIALASVTTDAGGTTNIDGGGVSTTGAQVYGEPVTIGGTAGTATELRGSSLTFNGALTAGSHPLTLTTDAFAFNGNVTGLSTLVIQPTADIVAMDIAAGSLDRLQDGFSSITLGRAASTAATTLVAVTFHDPVTIRGGSVVVNGGITGDGDASVTLTAGAGGIALNNDITTADQAIALNGAVALGGATRTLSAGAGAIAFSGTIDGASGLVVSNTGATTFGGALGGSIALASLTTDAGGTTNIDGGGVNTTGAQLYGEPVTIGGAAGAAAELRGSSLTFNGALTAGNHPLSLTTDALAFNGNVSGSSTLVIQPTADTVAMGVAGGAGTLVLPTATLDRLQDGFSSVTLGRAMSTAATTIGAVTFRDPVTIRGGSVVVNGDVTGDDNASITVSPTGNGTVALNANITTASNAVALNGPVILGADATVSTTASGAGANVTFGSSVSGAARSLTVTAGDGTFTVSDETDVASLEATAKTAINLGALTTTAGATLTSDSMALAAIDAAGQTVTLRNVTGGRNILLGGDSASRLALNVSEMNGISAERLVIGRNDVGFASGAIAIDSDVSPQASTLRLVTGAGITATGGGIVRPDLDLAIETAGSVNFTPANNDVRAVAASLTTAAGNAASFLLFRDSDGLTIDAVDGISGVTTPVGGSLTITTNAGDVMLAAPVTASMPSGAGPASTVILMTSGDGRITGSGLITGANVLLDSTNGIGSAATRVNTNAGTLAVRSRQRGGVFVNEVDGVSLATVNGVANSAAGSQGYDLVAGGPIIVDGPVSTANDMFSVVPGSDAATGGITLLANNGGITGPGTLTTGSARANGSTGAVTARSGSISLSATGNVAVGAVTIGAAAIANDNGNDTAASGDISITAGGSGIQLINDVNAGSGTLTLTANGAGALIDQSGGTLTAGTLTGSSNTSASIGGANAIANLGAFTTNGDFTLNDTSGGLAVTGAVNAVSGAVAISTAGGALALGANVTGEGVRVTGTGITQTAGTVNAGGDSILIDANDGAIDLAGTLTTTSNGATAVRIVDASTVSLGNVATGAAGTLVLGGAGSDNLSGAVTQTAGTSLNVGALIGETGASVDLGNANSIANVGALSTGGALTLVDTGGLTVSGAVTSGGAVSITTGGDLALTTGSITGDGVNLSAIGAGSDIAVGNGVDAGAGTARLTSDATISGSGLVTGNTVVLDSATGVGSAGARVNTAAETLAARSRTNGAVYVADADSVTLGTVSGVVNGTAGGGTYDLTAAGTITLGESLASSGAVSLAAAAVHLNAGIMTANGSINLDGAVKVGSSVTVAAGSGNVTFGGTVDGPGVLTVNSTGATLFNGAVGGTSALAALETNAGGTTTLNGGSVTTTADQTFGDDVKLGASTVLDAGGGNITFAAAIDGAESLTLNSTGTTTLGSIVGGLTPLATLTTNAGGSTAINAAAVNTSGSQFFGDAVTIGANATLTSSTANVTFSSTVDADLAANNRTLTVNAPVGTVTFSGNIGASQALADLDVTAGPDTIVFNAPSAQSVNVSAGGGNTVAFNSNVRLDQSLTVNTDGAADNNVSFNGTVNADAAANGRTLDVTSGGANVVLGSVGTGQELGRLSVGSNQLLLNGDVRTDGGGAIDFRNVGGVRLAPNVLLDTDRTGGMAGSGDILFGPLTRIDSAGVRSTLTLNTLSDGGGLTGGIDLGIVGPTVDLIIFGNIRPIGGVAPPAPVTASEIGASDALRNAQDELAREGSEPGSDSGNLRAETGAAAAVPVLCEARTSSSLTCEE